MRGTLITLEAGTAVLGAGLILPASAQLPSLPRSAYPALRSSIQADFVATLIGNTANKNRSGLY